MSTIVENIQVLSRFVEPELFQLILGFRTKYFAGIYFRIKDGIVPLPLPHRKLLSVEHVKRKIGL